MIKQLLVIDYTLETQQRGAPEASISSRDWLFHVALSPRSVLVQGLTSESRLPQLVDQLRALLTALVGHLPQDFYSPKPKGFRKPALDRRMSFKLSWQIGTPSPPTAPPSAQRKQHFF